MEKAKRSSLTVLLVRIDQMTALESAARTDDSLELPSEIETPEGLLDGSPLAVAVDGRNRIWLGNRTRGLSCFDGDGWRHYGVLEGLGGS